MNQSPVNCLKQIIINPYQLFTLILLIGIGTMAQAQTADEIIQKHFEVTGGLDAWNQLNSIVIEGEVAIDISESIPIKIEHQRPYFKRVSYIVNGQEQLSEGFDGENAFTYNNLNGKYKRLDSYQQDAFETDILNYNKKGFKAEKVGRENVLGKETYKVKLIKNTVIDYYWFDVDTYDLIQEETDIELIRYKDYKKVKGLTFAHRIEATPKGGKEYVVIFNSIIPNAAINDQRFIFE